MKRDTSNATKGNATFPTIVTILCIAGIVVAIFFAYKYYTHTCEPDPCPPVKPVTIEWSISQGTLIPDNRLRLKRGDEFVLVNATENTWRMVFNPGEFETVGAITEGAETYVNMVQGASQTFTVVSDGAPVQVGMALSFKGILVEEEGDQTHPGGGVIIVRGP